MPEAQLDVSDLRVLGPVHRQPVECARLRVNEGRAAGSPGGIPYRSESARRYGGSTVSQTESRDSPGDQCGNVARDPETSTCSFAPSSSATRTAVRRVPVRD